MKWLLVLYLFGRCQLLVPELYPSRAECDAAGEIAETAAKERSVRALAWHVCIPIKRSDP